MLHFLPAPPLLFRLLVRKAWQPVDKPVRYAPKNRLCPITDLASQQLSQERMKPPCPIASFDHGIEQGKTLGSRGQLLEVDRCQLRNRRSKAGAKSGGGCEAQRLKASKALLILAEVGFQELQGDFEGRCKGSAALQSRIGGIQRPQSELFFLQQVEKSVDRSAP